MEGCTGIGQLGVGEGVARVGSASNESRAVPEPLIPWGQRALAGGRGDKVGGAANENSDIRFGLPDPDRRSRDEVSEQLDFPDLHEGIAKTIEIVGNADAIR